MGSQGLDQRTAYNLSTSTAENTLQFCQCNGIWGRIHEDDVAQRRGIEALDSLHENGLHPGTERWCKERLRAWERWPVPGQRRASQVGRPGVFSHWYFGISMLKRASGAGCKRTRSMVSNCSVDTRRVERHQFMSGQVCSIQGGASRNRALADGYRQQRSS